MFNEFGELRNAHIHEMFYFDANSFDTEDEIDRLIDAFAEDSHPHVTNSSTTVKKHPDYSKLQPFFSWLPSKVIKKTFETTMQHSRTPASAILQQHYKSPFPVLNVHRRNESVDTDTVYFNAPTIDDRHAATQIFLGAKTMLTDVYEMKTDRDFMSKLSNNTRQRGAMNKLIRDRAQAEISNKVKDLLRAQFTDN